MPWKPHKTNVSASEDAAGPTSSSKWVDCGGKDEVDVAVFLESGTAGTVSLEIWLATPGLPGDDPKVERIVHSSEHDIVGSNKKGLARRVAVNQKYSKICVWFATISGGTDPVYGAEVFV